MIANLKDINKIYYNITH